MDFFASGGEEKMSLQDMIECDLNGLNGEMGASPTPLLTLNLPIELNFNDPDFLSSSFVKSESIGASSLDIQAALNGGGTVTLPGIQAQLILQSSENGNPNLMVNPTTGLPVLQNQSFSDESINITTDTVNPSSVLQNHDAQLRSPSSNVQLMSAVVSSPPPSKSVSHQTLAQTLLNSPLNSPTQPSQQTSQPLQPIQNTNVSYHQTLTHHLLSNNNIRKLQKDPNEKIWPKPVYSYSCLIAMALKNSETGALPVSEIYSFMTEHFPYFKTAPDGWKNSVRHNLSLNKCFEKIENPRANGNTRKGCLWGLNPHKIEKMEDEIVKWRKKDPAAVKRSMSHPDKLEEIERGRIGSHAPLPPEYLKALREQQLIRLNNMHANSSLSASHVTLTASSTVLNKGTSSINSAPTLTMVTPVYVSDTHGRLANGGTIALATTTTNGVATVKKTTAAQLLAAQQLAQARNVSSGAAASVTSVQQLNTQSIASALQADSTRVMTSKSGGGVQVTMVEVVPANKVQQIKTEPPADRPFRTTADSKPIVINLQNDPGTGVVKKEADENLVLDNNLLLDPTLTDLALQNGLWDELSSEGIDFSDIPASAFKFSPSPSPVAVLAPQNGTKSPLVGLLQSRTISART